MYKFTQPIPILIVFLIFFKVFYLKKAPVNLALKSLKIEEIIVKQNIDSILITDDITIENYFKYIDSIVIKYDSLTPYKLTEHLLVRRNSWIIDTLQNTDYYRMKAKDSFIYNQRKMIALPKGNLIIIPDSIRAKELKYKFEKTRIDINIPEFKLWIYEDTLELFEFSVRVGRNEEKYLEMSGRIQNLKTVTGKGKIVKHIRNPRYINPVNNFEYKVTKRDDGKVTKLPQIPFLETEINGLRYGQLIHPTTNPATLGKAYSNGCIGTNEADAWVIYYFAPLNTPINIRYDLNISDKQGNTITLKDIYDYADGN